MKLGMIRNACDDAAFRYVKGKGLDFIEACCNFPEEAAAFNARREEIKALVARHALPVLSCGRWNGDGGPLDADGRVREDFLAEAKETISTCAAIGCPVYNCGCNRVEGMSLFRNCAGAIEWFGTLLDFAGPLGVKIAVYNCPWHNFVRDMATWEIVLGELPDLGIKFDASPSAPDGTTWRSCASGAAASATSTSRALCAWTANTWTTRRPDSTCSPGRPSSACSTRPATTAASPSNRIPKPGAATSANAAST